MMLRSLALVATLGVLGACAAPPPQPVTPDETEAEALYSGTLFGPPAPLPPARANTDIARDILELGFFLESGREIPQFSRFEGPVRLRLTGDLPPTAQRETDRLLQRFRSEAGIDITQVAASEPAEITTQFVPRRQLRRIVPEAACFVVPNVTDWNDFLASRRDPKLDWTAVEVRTKAAVFLPADTTAQEIRDCLHEEVAQALGPLNDLYRVPDSVWNDDNFQTALTGFDMLVLRVWHHPGLRPGMSQSDVAARLPGILARLNPRGQRPGGPAPGPTPRDWVDAVEFALSGGGDSTFDRALRYGAAQRALTIATAQGWDGPRMAFSLFLVGRLSPPGDGGTAIAALMRARAIYNRLPGGAVHRSHLDMHLAAQGLASGQFDAVLALTEGAIGPARRTDNAALLATLMQLRAEALEALDRPAEAQALRLDSLPFARYAFGPEDVVQTRLSEIALIGR